MIPYSSQDVTDAFAAAKNANAALKNFLKRELKRGDPAERFVKDLRDVLQTNNQEATTRFVEKHSPRFEAHLLVLARYAHPEPLARIAEKILGKYADQFNATYERTDSDFTVKDQATFDRIISEVLALLEPALKEEGLPASPFMKNVLLFWIFEGEVLKAIGPRLAEAA